MMWFSILLILLGMVNQAPCAPSEEDKGFVVFSCPPEGVCYASPRNCTDNCNAAFSMQVFEKNETITFDAAMMSPHSYTAVIFKENRKGPLISVICSFHWPRGILAGSNSGRPITDISAPATPPVGHTDSNHTRCKTNVLIPKLPAKAKFKMYSGTWTSGNTRHLIFDEDLILDVYPAVENARILSTNEKVTFSSKKLANDTQADYEDESTSVEDSYEVTERPRYYTDDEYYPSEETHDDYDYSDDYKHKTNNGNKPNNSSHNGEEGKAYVSATLTSVFVTLSLFFYNL
ncbi:hypothetical protein KIN20_026771 [Parelaphostrongylus tenuis]|uniref:Ferric-chelate reductase 1 n=1 Tax=Parelaphostrongylus tenuis TaxID=148309 RepID=A0AAD5QYH0_PARTN|nr:hypothetical protein KIN20_026771 [Parelaphostrongylus tenuis]